ncbi:MAG: hypothetical protein J6B43_11845 [Lachnospiraceae bacterium]|nr:hypothetical protein [Lachnospiraceae bacterium]
MDKVTAFDALFTNNQIQKLKVLVSYVDSPLQRQLAIYIKFLELKYTMDLFRHYPELSVSPHSQEGPPDPARLCQEFTPYCSPQEQRQLNQFTSMLQTMSHYQEIMEMVQMFQEMFPEGMSFPGGDPSGNADSAEGAAPGGSPDMMAAGLGSLFGENMPDLSQLMSMMSMMQSGGSPPQENQSPDTPPPE